ncbi:MAG: hypothetical protein KDA66_13715 [Planctomycetaceae bacterium]|nr:hypothetical protein [Planctomycetaceae bacterium]
MNDKYFSRTACWHKLEDRLVVHDSSSPLAPRMITMEPWYEVAFMAADGEHTIDDFVNHMSAQYEGGEPDGLRQQIHEIVSTLIDEGILRIHDESQPLPAYYAEEYFEQDAEVRTQQMQADGLID